MAEEAPDRPPLPYRAKDVHTSGHSDPPLPKKGVLCKTNSQGLHCILNISYHIAIWPLSSAHRLAKKVVTEQKSSHRAINA